MQRIAERPDKQVIVRDLFSADEIGRVAADADVEAVLLGTKAGPLVGAHGRIASLGLIAAHPRLVKLVERQLGHAAAIAGSAYWRTWDGTRPLLAADGAGQVAIVFLGWRGGIGGIDAVLGRAALCDAADAAGLTANAKTSSGPFLVVRYAAEGSAVADLADDCLWQPAWCV